MVLQITFPQAKKPQLHQTVTLTSFLDQSLEHMSSISLVLMEYSAILLVYAMLGDVWLKELKILARQFVEKIPARRCKANYTITALKNLKNGTQNSVRYFWKYFHSTIIIPLLTKLSVLTE